MIETIRALVLASEKLFKLLVENSSDLESYTQQLKIQAMDIQTRLLIPNSASLPRAESAEETRVKTFFSEVIVPQLGFISVAYAAESDLKEKTVKLKMIDKLSKVLRHPVQLNMPLIFKNFFSLKRGREFSQALPVLFRAALTEFCSPVWILYFIDGQYGAEFPFGLNRFYDWWLAILFLNPNTVMVLDKSLQPFLTSGQSSMEWLRLRMESCGKPISPLFDLALSIYDLVCRQQFSGVMDPYQYLTTPEFIEKMCCFLHETGGLSSGAHDYMSILATSVVRHIGEFVAQKLIPTIHEITLPQALPLTIKPFTRVFLSGGAQTDEGAVNRHNLFSKWILRFFLETQQRLRSLNLIKDDEAKIFLESAARVQEVLFAIQEFKNITTHPFELSDLHWREFLSGILAGSLAEVSLVILILPLIRRVFPSLDVRELELKNYFWSQILRTKFSSTDYLCLLVYVDLLQSSVLAPAISGAALRGVRLPTAFESLEECKIVLNLLPLLYGALKDYSTAFNITEFYFTVFTQSVKKSDRYKVSMQILEDSFHNLICGVVDLIDEQPAFDLSLRSARQENSYLTICALELGVMHPSLMHEKLRAYLKLVIAFKALVELNPKDARDLINLKSQRDRLKDFILDPTNVLKPLSQFLSGERHLVSAQETGVLEDMPGSLELGGLAVKGGFHNVSVPWCRYAAILPPGTLESKRAQTQVEKDSIYRIDA